MSSDVELVDLLLAVADEYQGRAEGDSLTGESEARIDAFYLRAQMVREAALRLMTLAGVRDPAGEYQPAASLQEEAHLAANPEVELALESEREMIARMIETTHFFREIDVTETDPQRLKALIASTVREKGHYKLYRGDWNSSPVDGLRKFIAKLRQDDNPGA